MASPAWVFTQLGGKKLSITLSGYQAPFGRPRQKAIVEDGVQARKTLRYYSGNDGPTLYFWGSMEKPWQLEGRFMDKAIGVAGSARALAEQWKSWVRDGQICSITWGENLSVRGLVDDFTPGRESEGEIPWRMSITVLGDDQAAPVAFSSFVRDPPTSQLAQDIAAALAPAFKIPTSLPVDIQISAEFLDAVDDVIGVASAATGALVDVANQLQSFEEATEAEIERVRAAGNQLRTALLTMTETINAFGPAFGDAPGGSLAAAVAGDSAVSNTAWAAQYIDVDVAVTASLAFLADLDRQAELAARRTGAATGYTARGGDSWESISTKFFGGPSRANDIRKANGVRFGQVPQPGRTYQIPAGP